MKKYTIGLITGALLAVSAMMFMGSQNKNLGDITVNSITVLDDGYGGFIKTYNAEGKKTAYLGTAVGGGGFLETSNAEGKQTAFLGTVEDENFGALLIHNMDGELIAGFGASPDNGKDGEAVLLDRYGDVGWSASGKQ